MALVDQHQPVTPQLTQLPLRLADGQHLRQQPILIDVRLPHPDEILGAENQRLPALLILEDACQCRPHQRLAQADHVADQHTSPLAHVVRGYLHRSLLKVKERRVEVTWDAEL